MRDLSRKQMQIQAIERSRSYLSRIERQQKECQERERELSKTMHNSFIKKTQAKLLKVQKEKSFFREACEETEKQLESYYTRMKHSEMNFLKHQQEVSRIASTFLKHNSIVVSRSLQGRHLQSEQVDKQRTNISASLSLIHI
eukprot:TRINITY_DN37266_c0_g1_i1.p1 TRINITY_DN37266_c0_g1~~TRINITY_DN37266_c0_g1_i1.p1  ORF type:complete len:142 (+),score=17.26 TRINITY_DN37266_c0_g1_i1:181-606(+)